MSAGMASSGGGNGADGGRLHSIPLDILDDLASRFIINAPEGEKQDLIRVCFQVELAHWFFLDEYVIDKSNRVRSCTIREFAEHMFRHVAFLRGYADDVDKILDDWRSYKMSVPTYGAIIINEALTKVLLVQGFWTKTSWGFPKGKVNEAEAPHDCAAREVLEETGFDVGPGMDPDHFLEAVIQDQTVCLYPVPGVSERTKFQPRTKNEIRDLKWFTVADLPANKKDALNKPGGLSPNSLFMVMPFVKSLKKWLSMYQKNQIAFNPGLSNYKPGGGRQQRQGQQGQGEAKGAQQQQKKVRKTSKSAQDSSKPAPKVPPSVQGEQSDAPSAAESTSSDSIWDPPKAWSGFKFKKKDIFAAMSSTPGWI